MKRISIVAVIAALALAGCNQAKGPQTKELAVSEQRPLEALSPELSADAAPAGDLTPTFADAPPSPDALPAGPAPGLTAPPAAPTPRTHTVCKNDTLWSLAVRYLGDGQRWREIAALNPDVKPKAIPIGTKLLIPDK